MSDSEFRKMLLSRYYNSQVRYMRAKAKTESCQHRVQNLKNYIGILKARIQLEEFKEKNVLAV